MSSTELEVFDDGKWYPFHVGYIAFWDEFVVISKTLDELKKEGPTVYGRQTLCNGAYVHHDFKVDQLREKPLYESLVSHDEKY